MKTAWRGRNRMIAEGAAVELLGEGYPPAAAAEMAERLARLNNQPHEQPRVKAQPFDQIPDVVVQSALVLVEDDMAEDEARFAQAAGQPTAATIEAEIKANVKLDRVHREAAQAGIRILFDVEKEPDAFT